MRKMISKTLIAIPAGAAVLTLAFAALASAEPAGAEGRFHESWQRRRHESQRQFALGLCAGQALAQQGVTLPMPQAGQQPPELDASQRQALQAAVQGCVEQLEGGATAPAPAPSATPAPSASPAQ